MKKNVRMAIGLVTLFLVISLCVPMAQKVNAGGKPSSLSAMLDTTFLLKENGQDAFLKEYKKFTGIDLKVVMPAHNQYNERMLISFAAGDIPDIVEIEPDHLETYMQLVKEGAIIPLDRYIAKSRALKKVNKAYLNALKFKGKTYGIPVNSGGGCVTYIRKDWLDNLGLKVPRTYAELYNVAKAFTYKDPDKNGKNDTIGFTLPGFESNYYIQDFYQGADDGFVYKNGRWVDGFTQPNFKKALLRLRRAYQDKVLDQECFTNKTSTCKEKFFAGKVGIFSYWCGVWGETMDRNVKMHNPQGEVIALPAMKETTYLNRIAPIVAITKKCKDPEAAFKCFLEYMHDGGQGEMLFTHGVEGVHWVKKDGKTVKLPSLSKPGELFVKAYIDPSLALAPFKDPIELQPREIASVKALQSHKKQMKLPPISDTYIKYATDIIDLKKEIMSKIVLGQYTVDQGLKLYKEKAARFNIVKILKEANDNK